MYVFEFTDKSIKIFNKKNNMLIIEPIPPNIIINNLVYDYVKLNSLLSRIFYKYKLISSFFKIKIKVIIFEMMSPSNIFLFKNAFNNITNLNVEIVNITRYFKDNTIFISGNKFYYNEKPLKKLENKQEYYLVGNSNQINEIKQKLENNYKINILIYENNNTIIYEKV